LYIIVVKQILQGLISSVLPETQNSYSVESGQIPGFSQPAANVVALSRLYGHFVLD